MSFVYSYVGIFYTYLISGLMLFLCSLLLYGIDIEESSDEKKKNNNNSFLSSILKFDVCFLAFSQIVHNFSKSFYAPSLTAHIVKKFNVSIATVSRIQSISFFSYAVAFKYFTFLMDKLGVKILIAAGFFINLLSVLSFGPVSILPQ